jgi:hypothetical protein
MGHWVVNSLLIEIYYRLYSLVDNLSIAIVDGLDLLTLLIAIYYNLLIAIIDGLHLFVNNLLIVP